MRQLLKQRISIKRPTNTQDGSMGNVQTFATPYQNVPASVQPASTSTSNYYAQRQLECSFEIYVVNGAVELLRGDVVNDGTYDYQIIGWRNLSGRNKVMAIDCKHYLS